jgi:hypothetical protein
MEERKIKREEIKKKLLTAIDREKVRMREN